MTGRKNSVAGASKLLIHTLGVEMPAGKAGWLGGHDKSEKAWTRGLCGEVIYFVYEEARG